MERGIDKIIQLLKSLFFSLDSVVKYILTQYIELSLGRSGLRNEGQQFIYQRRLKPVSNVPFKSEDEGSETGATSSPNSDEYLTRQNKSKLYFSKNHLPY